MEVNLLRRVAANTAPTVEQSFVASSPPGEHTDSFNVAFPTPIRARPGRVLEMALSGLRTSYSWPNVSEANNELVYSTDGGATEKRIRLAEGAYELEAINFAIQTALKQAGDWDAEKESHWLTITPNLATLKAVVEIKHSGWQVDIGASSLRTILGWPAEAPVLSQGRHEAPSIVKISAVNEVVVHCDAVDGTYTKPAGSGVAQQGYTLGSFYPSVPPGYKIDYSPWHLNWLRCSQTEISQVRLWIADQDGRRINLRGEPLTVSCLIRDVAADT